MTRRTGREATRNPARVKFPLSRWGDRGHGARATIRGMTSAVPAATHATRDFSTIGVIGLGTMGAGIAEVIARNGYQVIGVELTDEAVERGKEHLQHSTGRAVARGKLSEDEQKELLNRITFTTNIADTKDCQLVIEAIVE